MLVPWEMLSKDNEESRNLLEKLMEVAAADPLIFDEVMRGVLQPEPCTQQLAADMVEKITRVRPLFLNSYRKVLLDELANNEQRQVRAAMALCYGRVTWDEWDLKQAVTLLERWTRTEQEESIIKNSLQSLHTLAVQKEWIRPQVITVLQNAKKHSSVSVRNLAETLFNPLWL